MMVTFLTGIVALILMRTLRKDFARYAKDADADDLDADMEESGWKQVHGDVFRVPPFPMALSVLVGTGSQLTAMSLLVILVATGLTLYTGRGAVVTTCITCYLLTSVVGGGVSGALYSQLSGGRRERQGAGAGARGMRRASAGRREGGEQGGCVVVLVCLAPYSGVVPPLPAVPRTVDSRTAWQGATGRVCSCTRLPSSRASWWPPCLRSTWWPSCTAP